MKITPTITKEKLDDFVVHIALLCQNGDVISHDDNKEAEALAVRMGFSGNTVRSEMEMKQGSCLLFANDADWFYMFGYWFGNKDEEDNGWVSFQMRRSIIMSYDLQGMIGLMLGVGQVWGFPAEYFASHIGDVKPISKAQNG